MIEERLRPTGTLFGIAVALVLAGCTSAPKQAQLPPPPVEQAKEVEIEIDSPYASTYTIPETAPVLITNARVLTGTGEELLAVDVLLEGGKISDIGEILERPEGLVVISGEGKWLTPGIIDVHSHMGVYPNPSVASHLDGNEKVAAITAEVWAEHSVWPQDPNFEKALAGGVTTVQILPGSANLFGGRGVVLKTVPSVTMQGMKFPDAPHSLKMACGENPKRVYGNKGGPATRMGNMAGYRAAWIEALDYMHKWQKYKDNPGKGTSRNPKPLRDLSLDTLADVLRGDIYVHIHCYRADEMANMIDLAKEFGYKITAFHHAVEAYKVAPLLAENDICSAVWADWWGFKQEAFDMVRENALILEMMGACAIIHSDDELQIQRLTQEVAKVMGAAKLIGVEISRAEAIRWLTANAAKALGLQELIGTIEVGKNADIVLWNGDPFSVYSNAEKVWIDGALRFEKGNPEVPPTSDFNLGIINAGEDRS